MCGFDASFGELDDPELFEALERDGRDWIRNLKFEQVDFRTKGSSGTLPTELACPNLSSAHLC